MTPEPTTTSVPPLRQGQRLSQPEFHRRYGATPPGVKAELIDGVVFKAAPLHQPHGSPHVGLATVLGLYQASTPGVYAVDNATIILGPRSEPQPDLSLRIVADYGGQVRCGTTGVIVGAGLWIDSRALLPGDYAELVRTAQRGLATRGHAAFVARLARRRRTP